MTTIPVSTAAVVVPVPTTTFWGKLKAWATQKTTIAGLATIATDASLVLTGATTWQVELPLAVGSAVLMAVPERNGLVVPTVQLAKDVLVAIAKRDRRSYAAVIADVQAEVTALGVAPGSAST